MVVCKNDQFVVLVQAASWSRGLLQTTTKTTAARQQVANYCEMVTFDHGITGKPSEFHTRLMGHEAEP